MTAATTAERLVRHELLEPRRIEFWTVEQLPEGVAAVIMPPDHQLVRCGSRTFQLPPAANSGVRSGSE